MPMPDYPVPIDWERLKRLRNRFLDFAGTRGSEDYWSSPADLELYDRFFAARIGWKWDEVLRELDSVDLPQPVGRWIDWGCGTGIASIRSLARFGASACGELVLWDRSGRARDYAARVVRERFGITADTEQPEARAGDVLFLSHVLNELSQKDLTQLIHKASLASLVVWVEPGTPLVSRKLIEARETLRSQGFEILAPCTTQNKCGMLAAENDAHWCHFFASVPSEAFQNAEWSRFSREMGIDLRALPVSYLVARRGRTSQNPRRDRVIGRARAFKGLSKVLLCGDLGVTEETFLKRAHKQRLKELDRNPFRYVIDSTETDLSPNRVRS